jgi:hypothetical protein
MASLRLRRFADVQLGEPIPDRLPAETGLSWEERARRLVLAWAGSDRAGMMHVDAPSPASAPRELIGRIYARHLDDSRCVDVEVVGRDRGHVCATALVRVALA